MCRGKIVISIEFHNKSVTLQSILSDGWPLMKMNLAIFHMNHPHTVLARNVCVRVCTLAKMYRTNERHTYNHTFRSTVSTE